MVDHPRIVDHIAELREWRRALPADESVGFVPTMGALHDGHLALVARAREENQRVAVSIFVNPTQFGPSEDFAQYPRQREADIERLRSVGVDCIWFGETQEMYPEGFTTQISLPSVTQTLCGLGRPGHFDGVAVVVLKLFHLFQPTRAYFGRKDFQQCVVIQSMVRDLDLPVEVVTCPTVREPSGLARSSRNLRLSERGLSAATILYRSLSQAAEEFQAGETDASRLVSAAASRIASERSVQLEYLELVHPATLAPVSCAESDSVMAVAARVESVRLIDNLELGQPLKSDAILEE